MNPEDPISHLERHYERLLDGTPVTAVSRTPDRPLRDSVIGLSLGFAAVLAVLVTCRLLPMTPPNPEGVMRRQARSAGVAIQIVLQPLHSMTREEKWRA